MRTIVSVNAKGGCGKSTIAMNVAASIARRGYKILLVDMDPQAQVTQWLKAGDGFHEAGTLTAALAGREPFENVISMTDVPDVWFVPSSEGLEALSREMTDVDGYYTVFTTMLATQASRFDFCVIDAPNQISPLMESSIWPADLFLVPFESTKAVRSYANFYQLVLKLRPNDLPPMMHILSNLSKQMGLRKRVIETMNLHGITPAATEVRTCGWLAQVDEHGGDILAWRPHSIGAIDIARLTSEVLGVFGQEQTDSSSAATNQFNAVAAAGASIDLKTPPPESAVTETTASSHTDPADDVAALGTFKLRDDRLVPEDEYTATAAARLPPKRDDTQELISNFTI